MLRSAKVFKGSSMNYWIKRIATALLSTLCSCGTPHIDEQYAAKVVKDALSISGNITSQKLSGGFTGAPLFKVTTDNQKYVVRFLKHKSKEERIREIAILKIASANKYGPQVYFTDVDQGVIIMEFLQQQPIMHQQVQTPSLCEQLAKLLQKIHQGPRFEVIKERDVLNAVPAIIKDLQQKNCKNIPLEKLNNIVMAICQAVAPHVMSVPCHNDLHPSNLIFLGDRFKAIDYERAAQADPYFDLAMVAYVFCETPQDEDVLLSTYLNRQPTGVECAKLYLFKQIAWIYSAVCFLTMIPELWPEYEKMVVPLYENLAQEGIDLAKSEHKLKFAKVLINHVLANVASQEFGDAIKFLSCNVKEEKKMKIFLETKRLQLRQFIMDDDKALIEIMSDGGMPHLSQFGPLDINYARGFLNRMLESYRDNGFGLWAVVEKTSERLIGYCGIHKVKINESEEKPELAYRIYKKMWGKGYATEAAMAVRDYAFNVLKLPEIVSCIAHDNERSARVAKKVGLTYWKEGVFKGMPCRVYLLRKEDK